MSNGPPTTTTDIALLRRAQAGDGLAFATLYDRHAGAALRVASRLLPNRAAAEDVIQEAFLVLWRTGHYDAARGSVRGYLLAVVHNRGIDRLRKDHRLNTETPIDEVITDRLRAHDRTEDEVERGEVAIVLRRAFIDLPAAQRSTLELAYFDGLTQVEIACLREEPIGTVKARVRLGLQKLGRDPSVAAWR